MPWKSNAPNYGLSCVTAFIFVWNAVKTVCNLFDLRLWFCLLSLPLGVWEGLRFVIVALPGLFSYFFFTCASRFRYNCILINKNLKVYITHIVAKGSLYHMYTSKALNKLQKKVREKSRECHNHKQQTFPDPKRKREPTNPNKHKSNKRTKSTKISSLFPKRGNRNTKRTEKHKNKMTHGKTYNKSPRRINHKATKRKTNTGTTALERSVE